MRLILCLAVAGVVTGVLAALRASLLIVRVDGVSMEPTLRAGSRLLVRRGGIARVRRGSVVVVSPPSAAMRVAGDPAVRRMIKRAVALPGDPAPRAALPGRVTGSQVPSDSLVVLGDNAARSLDSRVLGYFAADAVLGVVLRTMN